MSGEKGAHKLETRRGRSFRAEGEKEMVETSSPGRSARLVARERPGQSQSIERGIGGR